MSFLSETSCPFVVALVIIWHEHWHYSVLGVFYIFCSFCVFVGVFWIECIIWELVVDLSGRRLIVVWLLTTRCPNTWRPCFWSVWITWKSRKASFLLVNFQVFSVVFLFLDSVFGGKWNGILDGRIFRMQQAWRIWKWCMHPSTQDPKSREISGYLLHLVINIKALAAKLLSDSQL